MLPSTPSRILPVVLLAAAAFLLIILQPFAAGYGHYRQTIAEILLRHWSDPTWQHGALAFPIVAWLLWHARNRLKCIPAQPSAWGLAIMILAALFYFAGYRTHLIYFGFMAVQLYAAGVCIWLFGWPRAKACVFAWLMLSFAWPLLFLEESLAFHLRLLMVQFCHGTLSAIGIATHREGTALVSAAIESHGLAQGDLFRLNIDAPCSGLRSLFALMMVSALFAYHRQRVVWKRWVLFAMSLPLAVVANMVRIFMLIAASAMFGQEFAVGSEEKEVSTFHFLSGIIVFIIALSGLELISHVLNRLFRTKPRRTMPSANAPMLQQPSSASLLPQRP